MFDRLSAPFPVDAIHWRAQQVFERNGGYQALALAYIDARDVQDRLDDVCGPANWRDEYTETLKGRLICTLSLRIDGEWVSKSDGAGDTDVEGDKGAISDALKRAAVKWGVGRYLYELGNTYAPCEGYTKEVQGKSRHYWKRWRPEADAVFAKALASVRPAGPITDNTRDWLQAQIDASELTVQDFLRELTPQSLKVLTYEQLPEIQSILRKHRKAA